MQQVANPYFGKASALAAIAETELGKATQSGDKIQARQAAAKAWLAVGEAFRGLLSARGIAAEEFPRSERVHVFMHTAHGSRKLRQLYHFTKGIFHQDAYYEEVIDFTQLEEARQAMRDYLNEARELTK